MFDRLEIFSMASGLARHSGARQTLVARNIAHADTPGYRQIDLASFAESYRSDASDGTLRASRTGHFDVAASDGGFRQMIVQSASSDQNGMQATHVRHLRIGGVYADIEEDRLIGNVVVGVMPMLTIRIEDSHRLCLNRFKAYIGESHRRDSVVLVDLVVEREVERRAG